MNSIDIVITMLTILASVLVAPISFFLGWKFAEWLVKKGIL